MAVALCVATAYTECTQFLADRLGSKLQDLRAKLT